MPIVKRYENPDMLMGLAAQAGQAEAAKLKAQLDQRQQQLDMQSQQMQLDQERMNYAQQVQERAFQYKATRDILSDEFKKAKFEREGEQVEWQRKQELDDRLFNEAKQADQLNYQAEQLNLQEKQELRLQQQAEATQEYRDRLLELREQEAGQPKSSAWQPNPSYYDSLRKLAQQQGNEDLVPIIDAKQSIGQPVEAATERELMRPPQKPQLSPRDKVMEHRSRMKQAAALGIANAEAAQERAESKVKRLQQELQDPEHPGYVSTGVDEGWMFFDDKDQVNARAEKVAEYQEAIRSFEQAQRGVELATQFSHAVQQVVLSVPPDELINNPEFIAKGQNFVETTVQRIRGVAPNAGPQEILQILSAAGFKLTHAEQVISKILNPER